MKKENWIFRRLQPLIIMIYGLQRTHDKYYFINDNFFNHVNLRKNVSFLLNGSKPEAKAGNSQLWKLTSFLLLKRRRRTYTLRWPCSLCNEDIRSWRWRNIQTLKNGFLKQIKVLIWWKQLEFNTTVFFINKNGFEFTKGWQIECFILTSDLYSSKEL